MNELLMFAIALCFIAVAIILLCKAYYSVKDVLNTIKDNIKYQSRTKKHMERLERALNKACDCLTYDHFNAPNMELRNKMENWYVEDWKEWCLKDD